MSAAPAGALPSPAFRRFQALVLAVTAAAGATATLCLLAVLLDVLAGVLFRYVLELPLEWSEELARFLIVSATFLGAVVPLERDRHFQVEMLVERLRPPARRQVMAGVNLVVGASLLVLLVYGVQLTAVTMHEDSPAMGVPYGVTYATIPIGAALMLLVVLRNLWALLLGIDPAPRAAHPLGPDGSAQADCQ